MASQAPQWSWDPDRREYYYCSPGDGIYIYQSGMRIHRSGEVIYEPRQSTPEEPRYVATYSSTARFNSEIDSNEEKSRYDYGVTSTGLGTSGGYGYGTPTSTQATPSYSSTLQPNNIGFPLNPFSVHRSPNRNTKDGSKAQYQTGQTSSQYVDEVASNLSQVTLQGAGTGAPPPSDDRMQRGPPEAVTDPELYNRGIISKGVVRGNARNGEQTDRRFKQQDKRFFKVGKVFKILWPESPGDEKDDVTIVSDGKYDKHSSGSVITKVRWFVVVKEGPHYCTCIPISRYGGKGVSQPGVVKAHHAIIYSSRTPPRPRTEELPDGFEMGMLHPIRVRPNVKTDQLDPLARVNFSNIYTVEHNVKAYDFGDVDRPDLNLLRHSFVYVNSLHDEPPSSDGGDEDVDDEDD